MQQLKRARHAPVAADKVDVKHQELVIAVHHTVDQVGNAVRLNLRYFCCYFFERGVTKRVEKGERRAGGGVFVTSAHGSPLDQSTTHCHIPSLPSSPHHTVP